MNRLTAFLCLLLLPISSVISATPPKPNVLVILTDDQGYGDLGLHGNPVLATPNLDRLGRESTRFDRFYVSPSCAPTRAALLTGRYPGRGGVTGVAAGAEILLAGVTTLADLARAAGYRTGAFGKWHNGEFWPYTPTARGFDEFFGFYGGGNYRCFDTEYETRAGRVTRPGYITDVLTDEAMRFIGAADARPFFCWLPYNAPHSPLQVPDRFFDKYAKLGLNADTAAVYGMIECVDENVGRILRLLDERGLARDTLVVFLSDNGPYGELRYSAGLRGLKGQSYEGSVRVPAFFRLPGRVPAGRVIDTPAMHTDLLPTLCALTGWARPTGVLDGRDLSPWFAGLPPADWPDRMFFENRTLRSGPWRLAVLGRRVELHDLVTDPSQERDVAAEHPDVVAGLSRAYAAWVGETGIESSASPPPIPVGVAASPVVRLPTPLARKTGARFNSPFSQGHFTGWENPSGRLDWEIDVAVAGDYDVRLVYVAGPAALGTRLRVSAAGAATEAAVDAPRDPTPRAMPDRVQQNNGVVLDWGTHPLGRLGLPVGRATLRLEPVLLAPSGEQVQIKALELVRAAVPGEAR